MTNTPTTPAGAGVLNTHLASLLVLGITVLTAFTNVVSWRDADNVTQFVIIALQSATVFGLGLANGKWAGALKTGSAALLAIAALLVPLIVTGTLSPANIILVAIAGLNAVASEIGVSVRVRDVRGSY
jgi:hypothetical protein